jgi:hypothetical protein
VVIGQTFSIDYRSGHDDMLEQRAGRTKIGRQLIAIADDQAADQERDTVLHEVLHCMSRIVGLIRDDDEEERIVAALTPLLLDVLRRNPDLVGYLVGGTTGVPPAQG